MKGFINFIKCLFCRKVKHYEVIGRIGTIENGVLVNPRIILARKDHEHFKNTQLGDEK